MLAFNDIREGRMGFVGGATGAGWTPPNVFPTYGMGLAANNLFVGITEFTTGGWKLIDHNDWNNGDINVVNAKSTDQQEPAEVRCWLMMPICPILPPPDATA